MPTPATGRDEPDRAQGCRSRSDRDHGFAPSPGLWHPPADRDYQDDNRRKSRLEALPAARCESCSQAIRTTFPCCHERRRARTAPFSNCGVRSVLSVVRGVQSYRCTYLLKNKSVRNPNRTRSEIKSSKNGLVQNSENAAW